MRPYLLQFSGGNQQAGQGGNVTSDSLPGAMAAARVNGGIPNERVWLVVASWGACIRCCMLGPLLNGQSQGRTFDRP